jgi:transposase-like protein
MADPDWKSKKDPKVWRKAINKYESKPENASKTSAKYAVRTAVRNGSLKKPSKCPKCGRSGVRIVAHHTSYAKKDWTKISWKCDQCHAKTPERTGKVIGPAVKRALAEKKKKS